MNPKRYILTDEEEGFYRRSVRVIAPSKLGEEHWEGHWHDGDLFSSEQLRELRDMGVDHETVDRLDVFAAGDARRWTPIRVTYFSSAASPYFYRRLACPIVGKRGDRLMVITPSGHRKPVYPDGSLTRAKARRAA